MNDIKYVDNQRRINIEPSAKIGVEKWKNGNFSLEFPLLLQTKTKTKTLNRKPDKGLLNDITGVRLNFSINKKAHQFIYYTNFFKKMK